MTQERKSVRAPHSPVPEGEVRIGIDPGAGTVSTLVTLEVAVLQATIDKLHLDVEREFRILQKRFPGHGPGVNLRKSLTKHCNALTEKLGGA